MALSIALRESVLPLETKIGERRLFKQSFLGRPLQLEKLHDRPKAPTPERGEEAIKLVGTPDVAVARLSISKQRRPMIFARPAGAAACPRVSICNDPV